ncbi:MAG: hypothetical protein U9N57_02395 [Pseudomonadota bacterium]|nr:hypothetical protein [Pseudomonadota bacterium]
MLTMTINQQNVIQKSIFWIVIFAVSYNGLLAVLNANVLAVNFKMVAGFEFLILLSAMLLIVKTQLTQLDTKEIVFVVFVAVVALLISIINQYLFIDGLRNFLIIALFMMLGRRISKETLHQVFFVISVVVLAFLIIEVFALELYVQIFSPAQYYASTRGAEIAEFNDTGLFNNANAQQMSGRFGYGIFNGPRTSSIFLEQVSISNFTIILTIYLAVFWEVISTKKRLMFVALVLMVLITARSRSALALTLFALFTYRFLSLITVRASLFILPAILLIIFMVYLFFPLAYGVVMEDSFKGRIYHSGYLLVNFNLADYFSMNIHKLARYADSGIPYVITSYTLLGAIGLWLYTATAVRAECPQNRRFILLANLYFWSLLMVGAAVFTIKTAPLIWLLAGFLSATYDNKLLGESK